MREFPTFGPNLKDERRRKPHFAHIHLSETNHEQECVQTSTEIHRSDELNEQTEIEEESTNDRPVYLHAVDTSNQKYVPLSTKLWLKQKKANVIFPYGFW